MKPTIEAIIELSTLETGITRNDLYSGSQKACVTDCRKFASLFIFLYYGNRDSTIKPGALTWKKIGNLVGLDHSSVICACRKLLTLIEIDRAYRVRFEIMARILITE